MNNNDIIKLFFVEYTSKNCDYKLRYQYEKYVFLNKDHYHTVSKIKALNLEEML